MPVTRRNTPDKSSPAAPYSLSGASKSQLATLTVAALKLHLKHFNLSVSGKKSAFVDGLYSHLRLSKEDTNNSAQPEDTSTVQQNVHTQDEATQSNPNPLPNATHENALSLPQQLLSQLTSFLQQAQNPTTASVTQREIVPTDSMEDDCLSAASMSVQSSLLPSTQTSVTRTSILAIPPRPSTTIVGQLTPSLPQLTLPPIPSKIQDKMAKGEYSDFTTLLPKSMFGASESQSQTLTLQLSPSGENYSIRPQLSHSC